MHLRVWIVWSRNDRMRKLRLLNIGKSPVQREWEARTRKAQEDWIRGFK